MNTYRVIERIDTWATVEVEAETIEEALHKCAYEEDLDWSYETDYDSAVTVSWDLIAGEPPEDLLGVEFIDPYLGRDDIVWQVNAGLGDEQWQAEIVTADEDHDEDLGVCDLYTTDFIKLHRFER